MNPDWKKLVVPLGIFEDESILSQEDVQKHLEKNENLPKNSIIGTGTMIAKNDILHIVTCKHVVDKAGDTLFAVVPHKEGQTKGSVVMLKDLQDSLGISWIVSESCDLAMSLFPYNKELWNVAWIPNKVFCERNRLEEGWDVFYFGFPARQISTDLQPVVRSGMISLVKHKEEHRLIIDALAAGGNSGGPVLLKPMPLSIGNAPPVPLKTPFIGILSKTLENEYEFTPFDRMKYVAGLSMVVSADAISDMFETSEYENHIETAKHNKT